MPPLLLDACTLINLLATEYVDEIASSGNRDLHVVDKVADEVFSLPDSKDPGVHHEVSVRNRAGMTVVTRAGEEETALYISLSAPLDAGEAETLAVAINRGLDVATDDKAALRILRSDYPQVRVVRTSQLIRIWGEDGHGGEVSAALHAVETRASFHVPRHDPERGWWLENR